MQNLNLKNKDFKEQKILNKRVMLKILVEFLKILFKIEIVK